MKARIEAELFSSSARDILHGSHAGVEARMQGSLLSTTYVQYEYPKIPTFMQRTVERKYLCMSSSDGGKNFGHRRLERGISEASQSLLKIIEQCCVGDVLTKVCRQNANAGKAGSGDQTLDMVLSHAGVSEKRMA